MSLLDLIAAKRAQNIEEKKEEKREGPSFVSKTYEAPSRELFLAAWTPFLRFPLDVDVLTRRKYISWLLEPSCYVLNTFHGCPEERLLPALLSNCNPSTAQSLNVIAMLVLDITLMVPKEYEEEFLNLLAVESRKNPD